MLLPSLSQAYFTTEQTATRLTDNTVLFTVSYKFGLSSREMVMPIGSIRDFSSTVNETSPYLEYQILNKNLVTENGQSSSLILSSDKDMKIVNGQYIIPAGKSSEFTMVTIFTQSEISESVEVDNSLLVSQLPFQIILDSGEASQNSLNPSELRYYRTPSISLNK
jgi:hypothetical protein